MRVVEIEDGQVCAQAGCAGEPTCLAGVCVGAVGPDNDCDGLIDENDAIADWWNEAWRARRLIQLNPGSLSSTLTDFPILVVLDAAEFDTSKLSDAGVDLRFIDLDGQTELTYHLEDFDRAGHSHVWVRVPKITADHQLDQLWMYYDNPTAADVRDPAGTWDTAFQGVWHLSEPVVDEQTGGIDSRRIRLVHSAG